MGRGVKTPTGAVVRARHVPDIWYELSDPPAHLENHDFVAWTLLPLAMLNGSDLRVEGRISERTRFAAEKVSNLWEKWYPHVFNRISVTADEVFSERGGDGRRLMFFSGGVDSTYCALRSSEEREDTPDCMILHGLDYKYENLAGFDGLLVKNKPLRDRFFDKTLTARTNVGDAYFRHYYRNMVARSLSYYAMMAAASLYPAYTEVNIAADLRLDQQMWSDLVGNNTANLLNMKSANADLVPTYDDVSRSEKTIYLIERGIDMRQISICPDKSVQPMNCGVCEKCMRTKIVSYLVLGEAPDMFIDRTLDESWPDRMDIDRLSPASFLGDLLSAIENRGDPTAFPGYAKAKQKFMKRCERLHEPNLYNLPWRDSVKFLVPKPLYKGVGKAIRAFW